VRLPIDELLPAIRQHLTTANHLVLEAPPGAGKTTRVPPALLELDGREVLVLEPRRLAARLAARYVANERGESVGETVGYQVRFEEVAGPRTRLRFLTEGVLTRRMLSDPNLARVGCVVLDEFHERHLEGDLALALLRRLQRTTRPDLKIVVMSATMDAAPIAQYLAGEGSAVLPVLRSAGRQYPLGIEYTPHSAAPLEDQVAAALERLAARGLDGHALVFLPGWFEIRRAQTVCAALARRHGWQLLPLYGDQSPQEQDRAVAPCAGTKIILSTNVAESSITIEGVGAVIDSGLARVASHSPWSGLPALQVARVSQASANQRAGRAGRTGPGRAIRLYPLEDFVRRPAQDVPQILREDLAPTALLLQAMNLDLAALDWLDAPPAAAIAQAQELLRQLGATGSTAREMARYPLHPRLSRLMVEARRRGVPGEGCAVAALLSAGDRLPAHAAHKSRSDLVVLLEGEWSAYAARLFRQLGGGATRRQPLPHGRGSDKGHEGSHQRREGVNQSHDREGVVAGRPSAADSEAALLISILTAFPDRVARRRQGADVQLASGTAAELAPNSTVTEAELFVAVEAEDRQDRKAPLVRLASAIEPEWLLDLFPDRLREVSTLQWNRAGERVEAVTSLMFEQIAIETRRTQPDAEQAGVFLARKAVEAGLGRFADLEEIAAFQARVQFAAQHGAVAELDATAVEAALASLATGLKSFAELESVARGGGLLREIERQMPPGTRRLLEELAPTSIRLPRGRHVPVHYEPGQPPWIASRLQDFFGMRQTPAVGRGAVPVVVRLLAPNQRPVQMTSDLAGFWQRLYPQVRKELSRRYPKHAWPEDPLG
jgi:ATP-dependent helicase HrpB